MPQFKDNAGRTWDVELTTTRIKRVRQDLRIDLLQAYEGGPRTEALFQRLGVDPVILVDLLYVLCRDQARQNNVDDESFGESMAGDAIMYATTALLEAIASFTPSPADRKRMKRAFRAGLAAAEKTQLPIDRMTDEELETMVGREIESRLNGSGASSTSGPESSESTLEDSPSANF